MTSKSSFLTSSIENHRRRILVWIVSILAQIALYPGIMTIYLSRINFWNADGAYATTEMYKKALQDAVTDALGFKPIATAPVLVLAVCIAMQGFSYLHSRRKIDMYHSVPVSARRRFFVIYTNGLVIYLLPAVVSVLIAAIMGAVQGALTGRALAECGLAFLMNFLYFLVAYNISVLAVMLTGNIVITGFAAITMLFITFAADALAFTMKHNFFDAVDYTFAQTGNGSCIVDQYLNRVAVFKNTALLSEIAAGVLILCVKWFLAAAVILALTYLCYKKRPSEAAGKAIAIHPIKPFVKIIISVTVGIAACYVLYDETCQNIPVVVLGMIGATALFSGLMEAIYEFDIRAAIKHLVSTGISVAAVIMIFCIYYFDLFGYDSYVPDADEVESVAVDLGPYQDYWRYDETEGCIIYLGESDYLRENMFLTDIDAVCRLAEKNVAGDADNIEEYMGFSVLYRLKSGKEVSRYIGVDLSDPGNAELLDRIMGTDEYRQGKYQIVKGESLILDFRKELMISYSNGAITAEVPVSEAEGLREAWLKDMEQFDYSFARNNRPCGELTWELKSSYQDWRLPVYEDFSNTIAFLEQYNAYYPLKLRAEDIASIEITNWHYDDMEKAADDPEIMEAGYTTSSGPASAYSTEETVVEIFDDPQEIAEIIEGIYPSYLDLYWTGADTLDRNYDIMITFKANTDYPYGMGYYSYSFLTGQVPDFVVERTSYSE